MRHWLRPEFDYDGGGLHKGATGTPLVNGEQVAEGRVEKTMGAVYSLAGETAGFGVDAFSPATDDHDAWDEAFTGTIRKITVSLTGEHHLRSPSTRVWSSRREVALHCVKRLGAASGAGED